MTASRKLRSVLVAPALCLLGALAAPAAQADTIWNLDIQHSPTNFTPGATGAYWVEIANVGDTASSGTTTLTINLPSGLTRNKVRKDSAIGGEQAPTWTCPGNPGDSVVTCTINTAIARHSMTRSFTLVVNVANCSACSDKFATASISGGGAAAAANAVERTSVSPNPAPFGIVAGSFVADFLQADGKTPERQAGAHPDLGRFTFDLSSVATPTAAKPELTAPPGSLKSLTIDLPEGFVGDPTAVSECTGAQLLQSKCPASSQLGRIDTIIFPPAAGNRFNPTTGIFNMVPPAGVLNDLGMVIAGNPVHVRASLDSARNYAIRSTVANLNEQLPPFRSNVTLWGFPADDSHDSERCSEFTPLGVGAGGFTTNSCPSDGPQKPFLTVPFECGKTMATTIKGFDSWQSPGDFGAAIDYNLGQFSGCEQVPFAPTVSVAPTTDVADSPTGLDVQIDLPQDSDPTHIATSPLKDTTIALPEGLTVNPASANGLEACSPAQISLGTDDPVGCPDASKIADLRVTTPVLPDPVDGTVYLATQNDNPFGSLLAGYIVLSDPDRGILVKIPGKITIDPVTGRLTGTFEDNPQLPFSRLEVHFKGGAHSTLITPRTCGEYESTSDLSPWTGTATVSGASAFTITQAPGGDCPADLASLPSSPAFDAGTVSPISKSYSPFVLHLRREDGSRRFSAFDFTLPKGLTGKLAGTALCADGALAAAESRPGRDEQASPSCPLDSRVGGVVAGVGAGPSPYYAKGEAYLAGPYKGAPVSLAVITPAVAGPFDLGTILIRTPLRIDPVTAKITAVSDPIPQMFEGIPTAVRSVDVIMDRPDFTLTGTDCDPASIDGMLTPTLGQAVPISVRNQLSDCGRLPFKPRISLSLRGDTKRAGHPALTVTLTPRPGDANIASLQLAMPRAEFLDQSHIRTVCTRVQFAADACPAGAVYGQATVTTPLLDYPLSGNVYLRSSDNLLPDLVPDLRGPSRQPIKIEASGRTDSIRGGIRNTFDFVPDAPFTKLVTKLPGGKKGLLENSRDICARTYRATVKYTAHNGATYVDRPKLRVKCKKERPRKKNKRDRRGR